MPTERYPAAPPKPGHRAIMTAIWCAAVAGSILSFEAVMSMGADGSVAPLFRPPVLYLTLVGLTVVVAAVTAVVAGGVLVYRSVPDRPPATAGPAQPEAPAAPEPADPWANGASFPAATYGSPVVAETADVGS